jgi:AsmA protein
MRWVVRVLVALVAVAVVLGGALFFLPKERIAAMAADQVKAQTGRDLTLTGGLSLTFWPVVGVSTGPVTLANADWAGPDPMISADSLAIGIDAAGLLSGQIKIRKIEAVNPVVRLAAKADGTGNWTFDTGETTPAADTGATSGGVPAMTLDLLSVTGARLIYSVEGVAPVDMQDIDVTLAWPDPDGPADVTATLRPANEAVTVTARINKFSQFLNGTVAPVTAQVKTKGGTVRFDGRANTAGDAAGKLSVSASNTTQMLASFGVPDIELPRGLGQVIELTTDVTATRDGRVSLREMSLALDSNKLTGAADIVLSDVPQVTAQLNAGALDFSALGGEGGSAKTTPTTESGWSKESIDASGLAALNGSISLAAQSIDTGSLKLGPSKLALQIDRSRAVLKLQRVSIFEGAVSGELVANNRKGFSVGGNLVASDIAMQALLRDTAGIERLSGAANANIQFLGSGASLDSIMKSLSGKGALKMGRGLISGFDLDKLMRSGDATGGTTVFDSLTASYSISGGNLQNDDLLLMLANFKADGAGRIGLGTQDIDYLFTPIALRANSGQGLAIPVRIKGPWANPSILPDLSQALQLDVDGKVEEVKQKAEDTAKQKLQEELNITPTDGQSTEDALKQKLEDQAKDGLLKLLGQN